MVNVKLAGIPVCFENRYPDLEILCRGYETEECAVITLSVTQAEVEQERSGQIYEFTDGYLERATVPTCEPAEQDYSIARLFHQLLMPEKPEQMMQLLDMVDKLVETVPCYRLRCDMTENSVLAAYEAAQDLPKREHL